MTFSHSIARLLVARETFPSDLGPHTCDGTLLIFDERERFPVSSSANIPFFFSLPETSAIGNGFPFVFWEVMTPKHVVQIIRRIRPYRRLSGTSLTGRKATLTSPQETRCRHPLSGGEIL